MKGFSWFWRLGRAFSGDCSGATLVEWALMAALVGVVVLGVMVSGHATK